MQKVLSDEVEASLNAEQLEILRLLKRSLQLARLLRLDKADAVIGRYEAVRRWLVLLVEEARSPMWGLYWTPHSPFPHLTHRWSLVSYEERPRKEWLLSTSTSTASGGADLRHYCC